MSIVSLLELSIESIQKYKNMIDNHKSNKDYGSDIVNCYNNAGENLQALSDEVESIFNNDKLYNQLFEDDDVQDAISNWLNIAYNNYEKFKKQKNCEEKVALAYEWLFEIMLFTTDDEEIKSKITLNSNDIYLVDNNSVDSIDKSSIKEKSKVLVKAESAGKTEDFFLIVDEVIDDYLYSYIGDASNEEDLIIYPISKVFLVK